MIKRILVPLDPSPYTKSAVDYACTLSEAHGAELTGLVILDTPELEHPVAPYPPSLIDLEERFTERRLERAKERIQRLLSQFRDACEARGIPYSEYQDQGSPSFRIIRDSMYFDLIVTGLRTYFQSESTGEPGHALDELMDDCITPILAVPAEGVSKEKHTALIAYDGTPPAARAMHVFVHLAAPMDFEVTLFTSHKDRDTAQHHQDNAEMYLNAHGFRNVHRVDTRNDIRSMLDSAPFSEAELIVLGAHSKRRLLDFAIGSVSRDLIRKGTTPLLIG